MLITIFVTICNGTDYFYCCVAPRKSAHHVAQHAHARVVDLRRSYVFSLGWLDYLGGNHGGVLVGLGVVLAILILRTGRLPRIIWRESQVDFYLPGPQPISVPLEFVECFFLGSGVTTMPGSSTRDVQTRNLVVRIAERATDWQHRELPLHLGKWCEGYLTIRGLYCEVWTSKSSSD